MSSKRISEEPDENDDLLTIKPLGAGNEVGRSCILLQFKGKNILLDCGIHPGYSGVAALPFFDEVDTASIDILLITHFHLDHAAAIPYLLEKTNFKGRVFMTPATRAIYHLLLKDFIKVSNLSVDDMLFDDTDLVKSFDKIELIEFRQSIQVEGIKFTAYNAGHVLGAAMFLIEIAGVKILYTGDYSREEDRHLMAAEAPGVNPDIMICESTYGVQIHEPRLEREKRFTTLVHDIVGRGGRCLIPSFALGRAQELLLILEEYWSSHPELHSVPIYFASALARKCMRVFQTYVSVMNLRMRSQITTGNPFQFKHISNLKSIEEFDDIGPCVMMASPGMLQSGLSRELFEQWCTDKRNGTIIAGYCVEGTLAKHILNEPKEVVSMSGMRLPLNSSVHYVSFSAHVDFLQNRDFIDEVNPTNLVLVHGELGEMSRLKTALMRHFEEKDHATKLFTPRNCETVDLRFRGEKLAKLIGHLAMAKPQHQQRIQGVLMTKDYKHTILAPTDLREFTALTTSVITQRQAVPYHAAFSLLLHYLDQMFADVQAKSEEKEKSSSRLRIMDTIDVTHTENHEIILEWIANPMNDMIADSILAMILQIESSPASVKLTKPSHHHHHHMSEHAEKKRNIRSGVDMKSDPAIEEVKSMSNAENDEEEQKNKETASGKKAGRPRKEDSVKVGRSKAASDIDSNMIKTETDHQTTEANDGFLQFLTHLLRNQFGDNNVVFIAQKGVFQLTVNDCTALIDDKSLDVRCSDENVKKTIESSIQKMLDTLDPISS